MKNLCPKCENPLEFYDEIHKVKCNFCEFECTYSEYKKFNYRENGACKTDLGKPNVLLYEFGVLKEVIEVLEVGAKKYNADNWKGLEAIDILKSLMRHAFAICEAFQKKDILLMKDNDSGLNHLAHLHCNVMFLQYFKNDQTEKYEMLFK